MECKIQGRPEGTKRTLKKGRTCTKKKSKKKNITFETNFLKPELNIILRQSVVNLCQFKYLFDEYICKYIL